MMTTPHLLIPLLLAALAGPSLAKLPPPSDEAKAKAAAAAAKTAHAGKVAGYQLCRVMDKVAADYQAQAKKAGKSVPPPVATPACVDPGAFSAAPAGAAAAPAVAAAPAAPAKK